MMFNLGDKEPKRRCFSAAGSLATTAALWGQLSSSCIAGEVPTTRSLQQPPLSHSQPRSAAGAFGRGTAPLQVGSTHLKRNHSNPQNLLEDLGRGGTCIGPMGPLPMPRDAHQAAHVLAAVASLPLQLRIFHSNTYLQYLPALTI